MAAADTLPRVTVLCLAASLTGALALAALVRCGGECEVASETMEQALTATWRGDADALRGALDADPALAEGSVCLPEEGLSGRPSVDFAVRPGTERGDAAVSSAGGDFLVPPSGPLILQEARVTTHQLSVRLPLR